MRINENTSIGLPLRNLIGLIGAIVVGAWFAFGVIERLNKLETKEKKSYNHCTINDDNHNWGGENEN